MSTFTLPFPRTKAAAGDPQTFEGSLASIGRTYLGGKAPTLFKHEIGFQVLDQDEDNTRAVGVFAFRVGGRLLYVPLFYRNGTIKGTEQLRDPKRKITVPLSDNWVNKFLSDGDDVPGERISRHATRASSQPSLWQLKFPPTKYASDNDWVPEVRADLARAIGRRPAWPLGGADDFDLVKAAELHPAVGLTLAKWADLYPWFKAALDVHYDPAALGRAVKVAAEKVRAQTAEKAAAARRAKWNVLGRPKQAATTAISIKMVRFGLSPIHPKMDFDPDTLDDLRTGKNIYVDDRKDGDKTTVTAWLGGIQAEGEGLSNPAENGVYEVIGDDAAVHKCVVMTPLVGWGRPTGRCLVYRLKDGAWAFTATNSVWVRGQADSPPAYQDWVAGLPKVDKKLPTDKLIAAVVPEGEGGGAATVPFTVYDDATACPYWPGEPDHDKPLWKPKDWWVDKHRPPGDRAEQSPPRAGILGQTGRPFLSSQRLYVPENGRILSLDRDKRLKLAVGSDPDYFLKRLRRKEAMAAGRLLTVTKSGGGFAVEDPRTETSRSFKSAADAEAHLVVDQAFPAADARKLVGAAAKHASATVAVRYPEAANEKAAARLPLNFPNAPAVDYDMITSPAGFADDILPTETQSSQALPIQDMLMQPGAAERNVVYPIDHAALTTYPGVDNDPRMGSSGRNDEGIGADDVKAVSDAAASGNKELVDTSSLAAVVKHTRLRSLLDRVAPRIMKTVTDLGDTAAHLYWNVDEWVERFGQAEIGPLEDEIRSHFEGLGQLYLTLQERGADDGPDFGIVPEVAPGDGSDQHT